MAQQRAPSGFIYVTATSDNFSKVLSYTKPTFKQLDTLIQLGRNYTQTNRDTAILIIDKAIELCKHNQEKMWQIYYAKALSSKSAVLENEEGIKYSLQAREVFRSQGHKNGMASTDRIRGQLYQNMGQPNEAIKAYLSCIQLYKETKVDSRALLNPLQGVSDIYSSQGEYQKAMQYMQDAIMIADTTDSFHREAYLRRSQAIQLFRIGDEFKTKIDSSAADVAILLKDSIKYYHESALKEANLAVAAATALNDVSETIECQLILGDLMDQLGRYEEALSIANKVLPAANSLGFPLLLVRGKLLKAKSLKGLKKYNQALSIAEAMLEESKRDNYHSELGKVYNLITPLYIETGHQKKAIEVLIERDLFEKKENSLVIKKAIADAETKYQTSEKEKQILSQEKDILQLASKNEKIRKRYINLLGGVSLLGLFAFIGIRYRTILKERRDKKEFTKNLIRGQEEERKRIASDLHDGIGQSLLLIKKQLMKSDSITEQSRTLISSTLEEVRSISRGLHPFQLEKFGLTATIDTILVNIEKSTDIFVSKEIENIDELIASKDHIHLYRTVQEVLNNALKHAHATAIKVAIKKHSDHVNITIQDNGVGFDLQDVQKVSNSLGIRTMHERVSAIGGDLTIMPGTPKGTLVRIKIAV